MAYAKHLLTILNPKTQNYRVLEYLINNTSITVQTMTNVLHINSPRDIICALRKKGVNIESVQRRSSSGVVYLEYRLGADDE